MRAAYHSALAGLCLLAACAIAPAAPSGAPVPETYVRVITTDSNFVQLQIAVREFVPAGHKGPALWLAAVSHIGESNYYAALQRELDAKSLVLFEGVSAAAAAPAGESGPEDAPAAAPEAAPPASGERNSSLQTSMADALGLVFQLDGINYTRTNFRNCDLSIPQLRQLLEEQPAAKGEPGGESGAGSSFEGLVQAMQGGSLMDSLVQLGLRILGANPSFRGLARLALIDVLGEIQGDPSQFGGLPPDMKQLLEVLLQKRNQNVLETLKRELKHRPRHESIAVFYGAGHMADLERRIRQQFKYQPARQIWLTAFSVDLAQAGISPGQRAFMHGFLKSQLQQLRVSEGSSAAKTNSAPARKR